MPVDLELLGADFYAWTGHKALGPTGVGVLHGRAELLERMPPFLSGGDMILTVEEQRSTWNELPWKFEAGTSMIAQAIGLGAAVDYLEGLGMANVRAHEQALTALGARGAARGRRRDRLRAPATPPTAAASSRSRSTASTRTTSASCSTATTCACGRATTARSR